MSNFMTNKTVLIPYDFSDASNAAVGEAFGMIEDTTKVFVLHVLLCNATVMEAGIIVDLNPSAEETRRVSALKAMKEKIRDPLDRTCMNARLGDPGTEIVDFAREIKADFIIMPSHGRTGLTRLLLGSVAERVLRLAECPVIVLRHAPPQKSAT